jgi:hypothetical protein
MGNRVKKRDGVCVFLGIVPVRNENHNCHILSAAPSERRIDGDWYSRHRELLMRRGLGHLDRYIMTMEDYEKTKAPLGFHWEDIDGPSHIIALPPYDSREKPEVQYATSLGLYAHHQFNAALGLGRVKLEIHGKGDDRADDDLLDFKVHWSLSPQHYDEHLIHVRLSDGMDEQGNQKIIPAPREGWLIQPPTVEGQQQWPERVVFELYSEVWYPFCQWKAAQGDGGQQYRRGALVPLHSN